MSFHLSKYAPSVHRFDFVVTVCIIGILATWLLHRLNDAQTEVEKVILDTELNNFRLGIAETWVHKSVANQSIDIETLKNSNPMWLIAEKPSNYVGERLQAPSSSKAIWYFDIQKKRLIYVFNDGHQAQYKLVSTAGQARASLVSIGGIDLVLDVQNNKVADRNNINNFLD